MECRFDRLKAASCLLSCALLAGGGEPRGGITAVREVAAAYDVILDARFDQLPATLATTCPPAPRVACRGLEALSLWWQIQIDPESRGFDAAFLKQVTAAIEEAEAFTTAEPERAEAWFYLGAAYGARAQYRVHRVERLAAARDGKRIKESLERALAIDPSMHDAEFGIGMYRYYADVAPAVLRFLRWLFLLPGGNRVEGLRQLERAAAEGELVRGEAQFQIHLIYLWYEQRSREALSLIRSLQARYPLNPLFYQIEAEILDKYLHDSGESLRASERLLARAQAGQVRLPRLAETVARLNMATQLAALGQRPRALEQVDAVIATQSPAPAGALARAERLRRQLAR